VPLTEFKARIAADQKELLYFNRTRGCLRDSG
jgi:hypothetical protein